MSEKDKLEKLRAGTKRVCVVVTNDIHAALKAKSNEAGMRFQDWLFDRMRELVGKD